MNQYNLSLCNHMVLFLCVCLLSVHSSVFRFSSYKDGWWLQMVKNLPAMQETWVQSLGQADSWRREWQPILVFLPGKFHTLSWWCHPTISSSFAPFSCPQSFPASGSFLTGWNLSFLCSPLFLRKYSTENSIKVLWTSHWKPFFSLYG